MSDPSSDQPETPVHAEEPAEGDPDVVDRALAHQASEAPDEEPAGDDA